MNFVKRALLSIWKHKVKNLILIVTFAVISALVYVCICVPTAAQQQIDRAKKTVGSEVIIYYDKYFHNTSKGSSSYIPDSEFLNGSRLQELSQLEHLQSYNYETRLNSAVSVNFEPIGDKDIYNNAQKSFKPGYTYPNIILNGALDISKMDSFISKGYKLYSGRFIGPSDLGKPVAMISKDVAEKNKLKLGDKIALKSTLNSTKPVDFTIVGTYTAPAGDRYLALYYTLNPVNDVFLPYDKVGLLDYVADNDGKAYSTDKNVLTAQYFVDDPANVESFIQQAKILIKSNYKIESNNDLYKQAVAPLEKISATAKLYSLIIILAGVLIICLIIAIFLKGRNFEYGVLLALGEKKIKIIGQTLLEVILPVCLAFFIGLAAGNIAAKQISSIMLKNEVQTELQQQEDIKNSSSTSGSGGMVSVSGLAEKPTQAAPIDNINITLTPGDCAKLALVSLLIVIVSVIIPCVSILRFNPRKILALQK